MDKSRKRTYYIVRELPFVFEKVQACECDDQENFPSRMREMIHEHEGTEIGNYKCDDMGHECEEVIGLSRTDPSLGIREKACKHDDQRLVHS